jgi:hypothetical protein
VEESAGRRSRDVLPGTSEFIAANPDFAAAGADLVVVRPGSGLGLVVAAGSGLVKLFSVYVDQGLAHPLQILVALLQKTG